MYIEVFRWTLREKNVILKKENKIFSKQFVPTEPTKYGKKENFLMDVFRWS